MIRYLLTALAALLLAAPSSAETWHQSDTHHFTIYSNGSKNQLEDFSHEVERFDALLRLLWNMEPVAEPNKLVIYLLKDADAVDDLLGPERSNVAGFYRPRTEGSFAVGNRKETRQRGRLSGKRVLFHEYAHHFMFQNFQTPAPAWFIEGFAEFVATSEFKKNGEWTFGKPALHRVNEIEYFGAIDVRDLLTKRPARSSEGDSFYGWSWALTHMLYSEEMGRGRLVSRYINSLTRGQEPLEAAEAVFGDLDQLDRRLRNYVNKSIVWNRSPNAIPYQDQVSVRTLSEYDSEVIGLTLDRLGGHDVDKARDALRVLVAQPGATSEAYYQLAEAEYRLAHDDEGANPYDFSLAAAAVDGALGLDDGHMGANVLKGRIMLEGFDHPDEMGFEETGGPDEANWAAAREYFLRANQADPRHPWPLYEYANSFLRAGESDPQITPALETAFEVAPESAELRFAYAMNLAREGEFAKALGRLQVLANNPHGGRASAQAMIDQIVGMMNNGVMPIPRSLQDAIDAADDERSEDESQEDGDSESEAD